MIPEERLGAVSRGLAEAFGVAEFENIRRVMGGHTNALVFRIVVRGRAYLLRIIMRTESTTARHFACMRAAADAGVAPHVWYTSIEDRLSITDFVEAVPFPVSDALVRMPGMLRRLHALAPFPGAPDHLNTTCLFLLNPGPALDGFLKRVRAAVNCEELFTVYEEVAAVYPRGADLVSSHNDLFKPDNVLFDGERAWLVDWEAAFLNDRYADLAVEANLVVANGAEERVYLEAYFGRAPDEYESARFFLMRQLVHLFYGMAYLMFGSADGPVDLSETTPDFREVKRRMWAREVDLADMATKKVYGRVHSQQLAENVRQPRYREALRIVGDRHRVVG
jgi:hypothetical protein